MKVTLKWFLMLSFLVSMPAFASISQSVQTTTKDKEVEMYLSVLDWAYPGLNVEVVDKNASQEEVISDIKTLDEILSGKSGFTPSELQTIACKHISCGGGAEYN